jgi:hypothetical protein
MIVSWRCFERRGCRSSAGFELPVQVQLRSETGTSLPFGTGHATAAFEANADMERTLPDWRC